MGLRVGVSPRDGAWTITAALLGAAAFPPLGIWPCILVSITFFLWIIRNRNSSEARSLGILYGAVYGLGTMYWFFGLFGIYAISLIGLMAGYFGLLATLIGMTRRQTPFLRAALIALFAVGIEWLRGDAWYLRFPWYTAPHALAQAPVWIAPARWLGVYGLSFIIWFIAASGVLHKTWLWFSFLVLPLTALLLAPFDPPDKEALLVQTESHHDAEDVIADSPTGKVDLVVFPEYAFPFSLERALASKRGPTAMARKLGSPVVFGTVLGEYGEKGFQNVAAIVDEEGRLLETFPKQRPVPLMLDGLPGTRRPVVKLEQGTLGIALCYDFDAPEIAGSLAGSGATLFIAPTGDLMDWGRVQHLHHELLLRLRAVENDRWVLRATSSGRTEAIDPHGVPSAEHLEIGDTGAVHVRYAHRQSTSLGGRMYPFGPIALALTALISLIYITAGLRERIGASQRARELIDNASPRAPA
jgi:apolipoprotein N-acyltransferase